MANDSRRRYGKDQELCIILIPNHIFSARFDYCSVQVYSPVPMSNVSRRDMPIPMSPCMVKRASRALPRIAIADR